MLSICLQICKWLGTAKWLWAKQTHPAINEWHMAPIVSLLAIPIHKAIHTGGTAEAAKTLTGAVCCFPVMTKWSLGFQCVFFLCNLFLYTTAAMVALNIVLICVYCAVSWTLAFDFKLLNYFIFIFHLFKVYFQNHFIFIFHLLKVNYHTVCSCILVLTWVCSLGCKSCLIVLKDMQNLTFNNSCLSLQMVLLSSNESVESLRCYFKEMKV